jgi:hypothetical protein
MKNHTGVPDPRTPKLAHADPVDASSDELRIPVELALEVRRLIHDLSNGLEIIIQSSYLLSTADLPEESRQWVKLLEQGVQRTAKINQELRSYVREHS